MKKTKPPLFTRSQLTMHMNERIGSTTINEAIARNNGLLQCHFFEHFIKPGEYLKLLDSIRSCIIDPVLQGQLEASWINETIEDNEEITILFQHVRYACLYLELARAAEENKDRDRAWAFTNDASLMTGEIIEKSSAILNAMEVEGRKAQNSKNAQGRNNASVLMKEEVVRLLEEKRPESGWPSKVAAFTALESLMTDFIKRNNILGIKASNIESWLPEWLRTDELVKLAWEKTKRANTR
ncbi:hypothetical protein [Pseudomonas sp. ACM7]|uniref:hypothetical protein n=1 Tax=Pseudomonas sp. ACM7 TaxID=2052956 RepID=UPI0010113D56|nr:hypothetical protein [Pseudomonas sp. ACM7]QAY89974.1 hypothetical protein CUN63_08525 [Pseudomonas sp. ACM7]